MAIALAWRRSAAAESSPRGALAGASACRLDRAAKFYGRWTSGMMTSAPAEVTAKQRAPERLLRRKDFLRAAASGRDHHSRAFRLQMAEREEAGTGPARFGFTVTKKVAGAVGRNRIRRRLKEALRLAAVDAREGRDYVFIARRAALTAPFTELMTQIADGLARLDDRGRAPRRRNTRDRPVAP
jgi:ribonuclease P protein component